MFGFRNTINIFEIGLDYDTSYEMDRYKDLYRVFFGKLKHVSNYNKSYLKSEQ